ncbi:uncharacterized protein METZ01_LOCUS274003 [marine metagenome]|uniref:Uncharacterized protein n=1 Tax=marine metagenome TaxID=408172 RepID=A0A382KAC7_9ZZZZ
MPNQTDISIISKYPRLFITLKSIYTFLLRICMIQPLPPVLGLYSRVVTISKGRSGNRRET